MTSSSRCNPDSIEFFRFQGYWLWRQATCWNAPIHELLIVCCKLLFGPGTWTWILSLFLRIGNLPSQALPTLSSASFPRYKLLLAPEWTTGSTGTTGWTTGCYWIVFICKWVFICKMTFPIIGETMIWFSSVCSFLSVLFWWVVKGVAHDSHEGFS